MTLEEAKKAIDGFKADGLTDEEIAIVFHDMYRDDKITVEEFGELVGLVGYELTEEFHNMSEEEKKERLYDEVDEGKELEAGEENPGEGKEEPETQEKPEPETKTEEESEEEKARKLFGLNK